MRRPASTARPIPWASFAVAVVALGFQLHPASREQLLFDRTGILDGQWWRLWTGHLIHWGWPHWAADTGLLLALGWLGEARHRALFVAGLFAMPAIISAVILGLDPTMERYAGLSAVNMGLLVFVACCGWGKSRHDWFYPAVLFVYIAEVVFEALHHGSGGGLIRFDDGAVRIATIAHIAGALCGLGLWGCSLLQERARRAQGRALGNAVIRDAGVTSTASHPRV